MKTASTLALLMLIGVLAACSDPTANHAKTNATEAKPETQETGKELKFSNENSKISFRSDKVITGGHDGGFNKFTGKVVVDGTTVKQVEVNIDMNGLWTDDDTSAEPKLTTHLKSKDFFEVDTYPTARFMTTEIKAGGEGGSHTVTGNLTLRDVTKSVTFPADITTADGRVAATAKFKIDRQQWGVVYKGKGENLIKDDVALTFEINAG